MAPLCVVVGLPLRKAGQQQTKLCPFRGERQRHAAVRDRKGDGASFAKPFQQLLEPSMFALGPIVAGPSPGPDCILGICPEPFLDIGA